MSEWYLHEDADLWVHEHPLLATLLAEALLPKATERAKDPPAEERP